MKYRELIAELQKLDERQLDMDVTVFSESETEYIAVMEMDTTIGTDVLDDDHPILCIP